MVTVIARYYDDRNSECPLLRYVICYVTINMSHMQQRKFCQERVHNILITDSFVVLQKVGCDKMENSYAEDDRCGVCGGRGDSCKVMSGTYKKKLPKRGKYRVNYFIYVYILTSTRSFFAMVTWQMF